MKSLEELNLIDDFLMNAVAQDREVGEPCLKRILSVLLEREIDQVEITPQRLIKGWRPEIKGVRLDVEVRELVSDANGDKIVASIFDVEPHNQDDLAFPKFARYRQARIDGNYMQRGDRTYEKLPDLYIISITGFDVFGEDQMVYTFHNQCKEVPRLVYKDGVNLIFFNTEGTKGGSQAIRNMLKYIRNSREISAVDEDTRAIDGFVQQVKTDPILRESYMTIGDVIDREKRYERRDTRIDDILDLLADLGEIPDGLRSQLEGIRDEGVLKHLHKVAAHAESIEDFNLHMPIDL